MGCVMCTPTLEGIKALKEQTSLDGLTIMVEPNTLTGEPLALDPEPFINYIYTSLGRNSNGIFMTDGEDDRNYTFGELLLRSKSWAQWLKNRGLGKGSIVSISCDNNLDGFSVILGTWLAGAAANPINFNFTASDIKTMFECTEPDVIYCSKYLSTIEEAVQGLDKETPIVTPGGINPNIDLKTVQSTDTENFQVYQVEDSKDHVASIMFTSGTTGIPKGIQILDSSLKVFASSAFLGFSPVMITSPMFWVSNLVGFCYSLNGIKPIIIPKKGWTTSDILQTIETYKPCSWFTGHSLLLDLANKSFVRDFDISSLKFVITGGTLLMAAQRREINENLFQNKLYIKHIYGSTEVGIITRWRDDIDINNDEYNSVGTLEKGVTLKVMDSRGRQLGPREEGEIWIKSMCQTPGYITLKRRVVKAADENGWYHMGDLGYYDEKKLIYVVGREKDIMKFRGVQIAPAEIESVLNRHPDIFDSCVVGKFDVADGDLPVAFVVLKESSNLTESGLQEYLKDNLAEIKLPHEIHFLESIPKSAVGKHLRNELENMLK